MKNYNHPPTIGHCGDLNENDPIGSGETLFERIRTSGLAIVSVVLEKCALGVGFGVSNA